MTGKKTEKKSTGGAARACPICGKPSVEKYRPFCSARCKQVDLSRWLGESYAIPGEPAPVNGAAHPGEGEESEDN